jgi:hypothetical protein
MKLSDFQRREDPQITKLGCILSIVGMVGLIILYYLAMTSRDYYLIRVLMAKGFVFSLLFPILRLLQKPARQLNTISYPPRKTFAATATICSY